VLPSDEVLPQKLLAATIFCAFLPLALSAGWKKIRLISVLPNHKSAALIKNATLANDDFAGGGFYV